jgi:hypothetical protein
MTVANVADGLFDSALVFVFVAKPKVYDREDYHNGRSAPTFRVTM